MSSACSVQKIDEASADPPQASTDDFSLLLLKTPTRPAKRLLL